jgi:3-methyladenine DNA glycosylase AlkD
LAKVKWETPFLDALRTGSVQEMLGVLQDQATDHAKTANSAVKTYALQLIKNTYKQRPERVFQLGVELANSQVQTGEEMGAVLLAEEFAQNPDEATTILHRLADSDSWEVREWAASACGHILTHHFEVFYPVMQQWVRDESGNVRRAVALAAMFTGKARIQGLADPLLDLLEALLPDRDAYVKKNLGAFAIGDGMLRYYPTETALRMHKWVQNDDEQVRWNVAMIFSAAEAAKKFDQVKGVLQTLLTDERTVVKRAVNSAVKKLQKRIPEKLEPLLNAVTKLEV